QAYTQLFGLDLPPLPVTLLPKYEHNAYFDGKVYKAPPAVAQLPEVSWHEASWPYVIHLLPGGSYFGGEGAIQYSYSDVLPVAIRQMKLVPSDDPTTWDLSPGAV